MVGFISRMFEGMRVRRVMRASRYSSELADLPSWLLPEWRRLAGFEFKGIPTDALFFARAAEGLMMFFDCVAKSGKPCALPSKAADSVWHVWKKMAPSDLDGFCKRHFGRTIPHVEAADMGVDMGDGLAATLVKSREQEGLDVAGLNVPKLFSLDRRLGMPGGYAYRLAGSRLGFSNMNAAGMPAGEMHYPVALAASGLLAAGLVSQMMVDDALRRQAASGTSCGSTGSTCGSSIGDDDGDSGGSGGDSGDGGSSCGSGCGGGGGD